MSVYLTTTTQKKPNKNKQQQQRETLSKNNINAGLYMRGWDGRKGKPPRGRKLHT